MVYTVQLTNKKKLFQGWNFLKGPKKTTFSFSWPEVGAVQIVWLKNGLRCCSRRPKTTENIIWLGFKPCLENQVSKTTSQTIMQLQQSLLLCGWGGENCCKNRMVQDFIWGTWFCGWDICRSKIIFSKNLSILEQNIDSLRSCTIFTATKFGFVNIV